MQSRKRVWLLFTAIIIAVFAMVGCIPEITPDKTPPDVTAKSVTLSATTINQGDPLTVTVQVTAEDKRSNLKNAQIKLMMKKPGESAFSQVGATVTKLFAENVKTGTVTNDFVLEGANFDVGGTYEIKAEIWVSDVKDNISQEPVEIQPSGSLQVQGQEEQSPKITDPIFSPRVNNAVPPSFDITVGATDDDGDLVYFEFRLLDEETDIVNIQISKEEGVSEISTTTHVNVDMGDKTQKTLRYFILARDAQGHTTSLDNQELVVRITDLGYITKELHVGDERIIENAQSIGNYAVSADPSVIPTESPTVYELPFGITTLTFDIYPSQAIPTNMAKVFIYSEPEDIFNQDDQFKRGESNQIENMGGGNYRTSIEFANLSADNAKWLALYIQGAAKPWYVWKISAADHATTPQVILKDFGTIEEFIEGKPIEVKLNLKDELLLSLDDLEIQFLNNQETTTLEQLIFNLNEQLPADSQSTLGWPTNDSWRFAVRYHAKVTYENYPEAFEDIRKRDLEPDPDPKTVYAISNPVSDGTTDHIWYRFDAETGQRVNWNNNFVTNDMLYFFGVPDRQIQSLNRPEYITDLATMTVHLYPEIVVVDRDDPETVLFVSDAALGAGNRYILETASGYKQYNIMFTAQNAKRDTGSSVRKVFPIYADNTSPEIKVTYGPSNVIKYFADRRPEELKSGNNAYDRIAPPMFFVDSINLKAGQTLSVDALDNVALYDFAVFFVGEDTVQNHSNWRSNLPAILNPNLETIDMPMGFDFLYKSTDEFYTGQDLANKNKEDLPTKLLNQILINEPIPITSKAVYTDIYPTGGFSIDNRYEVYENYTWSGVRNAKTTALIDVTRQEQYFTRRKTTVSKQINMPSVPGTYWVWIIARDRGAQDSWLFDYENDRVNIDPLTGNPEIYSQDVLFNQSNYFTVDPNLENVEVYYENSESESDAPMSVLLRVRVESHSMDIQRLDIHEPCLVSYPDEDSFGKVWFAHSYNVLQLDGETKVSEFDEGESLEHLPRDMYPVFKREELDKDAGNRFGLTPSGNIMTSNLWEAVETVTYGGLDNRDQQYETETKEAIPVVGGNNSTTFRVKTHEDIEKVQLEFINKKVWTAKEYSAIPHTLLESIVIEKDPNSSINDGEGQGGYWEWELDLKSYPGFDATETYCSIVVKAFNNKNAQFYEQWQWPIFVDTKGPEIDMYSLKIEEDEEGTEQDFFDHLRINKWIEPSPLTCCPSTVERWIGFQVKDGGGLMFEFEKGFTYSWLNNVTALRPDRRYDLCSDTQEVPGDCSTLRGHKVILKANDSWYNIFQQQNIYNERNSRLLGFPSYYPSVTIEGTPVSSLKYLTREVVNYENLELSEEPWHKYYTDTNWGAYDGTNHKTDPREIPTIAFFNNIDLLNGLWENNDDITKKFLEFSLRDELGNVGTWESYLARKSLYDLEEATVTFNKISCREGVATVEATSVEVNGQKENIASLFVQEKEHLKILSEFLRNGSMNVFMPATSIHVTSQFAASNFLVPAFQTERMVQIVATSENHTEMATELTYTATYAGLVPEIGLMPGDNVKDLIEELTALGKQNLILLLKSNERYYVEDIEEAFTMNYLSEDDNVDKYMVGYNRENYEQGTLISSSSFEATISNNPNVLIEESTTTSIPASRESGHYDFSVSATDCADGNGIVSDPERVYYQNPDTFVATAVAVGNAPGGLATGVEIEFQSDILFENADDLLTNITFFRMIGGNEIPIPMNEVYQWDQATSDWKKVGTLIGRNKKFRFASIDPFNDPLSISSRELFARGSTYGLLIRFETIYSIALGRFQMEEFYNLNPTLPVLLTPANESHIAATTVDFEWKASSDPDGEVIVYDLYLTKDSSDFGLPNESATDVTKKTGVAVDPSSTYYWKVVAKDPGGAKAVSETWWFTTVTEEERDAAATETLTNLDDSGFATFTDFDETTKTATLTDVATDTEVGDLLNAMGLQNNEEIMFPITFGNDEDFEFLENRTFNSYTELENAFKDQFGPDMDTKLSALLDTSPTEITLWIQDIEYTIVLEW